MENAHAHFSFYPDQVLKILNTYLVPELALLIFNYDRWTAFHLMSVDHYCQLSFEVTPFNSTIVSTGTSNPKEETVDYELPMCLPKQFCPREICKFPYRFEMADRVRIAQIDLFPSGAIFSRCITTILEDDMFDDPLPRPLWDHRNKDIQRLESSLELHYVL